MQSYKLSVSKDGKKYTIVFKAETEKLARERVHKEWYSILGIEENNEKTILGNVFIFTGVNKSWDLKHWKIVWDDILKTYIKLRKDLEYEVKEIYYESESNLSEKEKQKIVSDLNEEYNLFFTWKEKLKIDELREKLAKEKNENKKQDNFYLKKELDETYKIIDFILKKLENLLSWTSWIDIDLNQKDKLKIVYNSIIKLKKTTNLAKLKEIWELALVKIWRIELKNLENKQNEGTEKLLKETNVLLKKFWSKKSFIEKKKDIKYIINNFFNNIFNIFNSKKDKKIIKNGVDKYSHSYIKNILFLRRYKEKLKDNNKFFFKHFFEIIFNSEKRGDFFIRRRVIKQNITLFKAKEKWIGFSYTTVKKWITKLVDYILAVLFNIKQYLFTIIVFYTITFIIFLNINYYYNFRESSYEWIFYFLVLFFIYLILHFTRNLFLIILNFVILFFIIIFWIVNF